VGPIVLAFVVGCALPFFESLSASDGHLWLELATSITRCSSGMMIEAPGTYQHSLVVANLAETAAESVGANAALARVCSYFHDIGKLVKPEYFVKTCGATATRTMSSHPR
jgi:putative nucleotidyltransferase with HDIG domain